MTIAIHWNTLSTDQWDERFARIPRSNLLQSYDYAKAHCPLERQKARWGLIEIDGREAGLIQILEASLLWNLFHAVMIDRGPLWFDGFGNAMHVKRLFAELARQFPARRGRKRRILPEIADGPAIRKMLEQNGLTRLDRPGYETIWLDLTPPLEDLRVGLKSNWRNKLNKAERAGLSVSTDISGAVLAWLLATYDRDKTERDYGGPSPAFLRNYLPLLAGKDRLIVLRALIDGEPAAFISLAIHGRSATYLAGWSSPAGRDAAAHHLLLWQGVKMLQNRGIKELDLGGVNDEDAKGIKTFKEGLGGTVVCLVGHYV